VDDLLDAGTRCPHCRAAVRPGAPWCTLCHADLRPPPPAPEPVLPAPAAVAAPGPPFDPLTAPAARLGLPAAATAAPAGPGPSWPCTTCGAPNPIAADACLACGAGFLAGLRETEGPLLELPGVGDLTRMSRGQRVLVAFGVVLAFVAFTALLGFVLG
jgi:hypothetical protein